MVTAMQNDFVIISDEASPAVQTLLREIYGDRLQVMSADEWHCHCPHCGMLVTIADEYGNCWECGYPGSDIVIDNIPF
jgi:hypothetical protein